MYEKVLNHASCGFVIWWQITFKEKWIWKKEFFEDLEEAEIFS